MNSFIFQRSMMVILISFMVFASGCSRTPEDTVVAYIEAMSDGDIDEVTGMTYIAGISNPARIKKLLHENTQGVFEAMKDLDKVEVLRSTVDDDVAVVKVRYIAKNGACTEDVDFSLVNINGEWKVSLLD